MKNYFKSILAVSLLCFHFGAHSMNINFGVTAAYNCDINSRVYKNYGSVHAFNNVTGKTGSVSGSGTISAGNNVDWTSDSVNYSGTISAGNVCKIKAKTLEGEAKIEAPTITIVCDEFKFAGSAVCSKECTIYAKQEVDASAFKREGIGVFKVVVSPHDVEFFNADELSVKSYSDCVNGNEQTLGGIIEKIRTHAVLNGLDDKSVLSEVRKNIENQANFHKDRLQEKTDGSALRAGLGKCGVTAVGLVAAYMAFKHAPYLAEKCKSKEAEVKGMSFGVAVLSGLLGAASYEDFYNWRNPKHEEKHAKLTRVMSKIDHALATERVAPERIITL